MTTRSLPPLPLNTETRDLVDFCLSFRTVAGFIAVYDEQYSLIQARSRKKRGLKAAAYEATEQLYGQYLNIGRRFADKENFFNERSRFLRRSAREPGNNNDTPA